MSKSEVICITGYGEFFTGVTPYDADQNDIRRAIATDNHIRSYRKADEIKVPMKRISTRVLVIRPNRIEKMHVLPIVVKRETIQNT